MFANAYLHSFEVASTKNDISSCFNICNIMCFYFVYFNENEKILNIVFVQLKGNNYVHKEKDTANALTLRKLS